MNSQEQFLYNNIQELFYGLHISNTFEDMFIENNTNNKKIDKYFDSLREKVKGQIGGSLLISLITLKQYINESVNNINPK
jgi:hypothetical protein